MRLSRSIPSPATRARALGSILFTASLAGLGVLGACAAPGCNISFDQATFKATQTATAAHAAAMPVKVTTENGGVTVQVGDAGSGVSVTGEVRATTAERAQATRVLAERDGSGQLVVSVAWPEGVRLPSEGCTITVTLPNAKGVTVVTSNGPVKLVGLDGEADARTSNGGVTINDHNGPAKVRTSNASVKVDSIGGALDAATSNGSVTVSDASSSVRVSTSNASVECALAPESPGPVNIETSNGRVSLRVVAGDGAAFKGTLKAKTSNGRITMSGQAKAVSSGKTTLDLGFGDGPESTIRTSNGPVRIDIVPPAAPAAPATP
jgi:hypothetical protein